MKHLCIWIIRFYQKFISPLKGGGTCRFHPTCSAYALEAFRKRGFFVGMLLTVSRIFRCQPYCVGGWDPVPEKGLRNPKYQPCPMTKYFYPEEYELTNGDEKPSEEQ